MKCTSCGNGAANHSVGHAGLVQELCCKCYVSEGNDPSEWHPDCMKEANRIKEEKEENGLPWVDLTLPFQTTYKGMDISSIGVRRLTLDESADEGSLLAVEFVVTTPKLPQEPQ